MRYRHRRAEIEAVQSTGNEEEIEESTVPSWFMDATETEVLSYDAEQDEFSLRVGRWDRQTITRGDWIVRDEDGLLSVWKPDVFAATYKPISAPPTEQADGN